MSPAQILRVIWARKGLVAFVLAALIGLALAVSLLMSRTYTATAEVIIDLRSPDPVLGRETSGSNLAGFIGTQVDIIASERVSRRVVSALALHQEPTYLDEWREETGGQADIATWLAQAILKRLDVRPSKEGNVVRIAFKAPDPALAARVANGFANAYLETVVQLKLDPARQNAEFFASRIQRAREDVERAQARLSEFQRQNQITVNDEKLDVENARLTELSTQLVVLQGQLADLRARESSAARRNPEAMPEVLESRLVQQLRADIAKAEGRLEEAGKNLGGEHPQFQALQAELSSLRGKLAAEIDRYARGVSQGGAVGAQREQQVRAALEQQRAKVLKLKSERDQMSVMQKEVESAQRAFDLVAQRQLQTGIESENRHVNVALLTPAAEPFLPSSPKLMLNLLVGALFGLMLGAAVALLREMGDRRARTAQDVIDALGLPMLASIPATAVARHGGASMGERLRARVPKMRRLAARRS